MLLTIKHPTCNFPKININEEATLADLKEEIDKHFLISPSQQKLICGGRVLGEGQLKNMGVKDGSLLHLVIALRGG